MFPVLSVHYWFGLFPIMFQLMIPTIFQVICLFVFPVMFSVMFPVMFLSIAESGLFPTIFRLMFPMMFLVHPRSLFPVALIVMLPFMFPIHRHSLIPGAFPVSFRNSYSSPQFSKFVECIFQCLIFILLCDYTSISNNVKFRQSCFCYKEGSNTKLAHFAQEMLRKVAALQRRPWMTAAKASKRVDSFSCLPHLVIVFRLITKLVILCSCK